MQHNLPDAAMSEAFNAPSKAMLAFEAPRCALEYLAGWLSRGHIADELPRGDGGPVIVFPGLAFGDFYTSIMRGVLDDLGYVSYGWGRGINTGPAGGRLDALLADLLGDVTRVYLEHKRPVRLVGWSLGGIYAREIAKLAPEQTRVVITLGTPFAGTGEETNVSWLYRLVNGQKPVVDEALARRLRTNPCVPTTSIYSRSDGVVAWQTCLLQEGPLAENVEVDGSHCGLGWNAAVMRVVADRLAQREGAWRPYALADTTAGAFN
jgi:hypothetical protein